MYDLASLRRVHRETMFAAPFAWTLHRLEIPLGATQECGLKPHAAILALREAPFPLPCFQLPENVSKHRVLFEA
jgi:hypothetical protein